MQQGGAFRAVREWTERRGTLRRKWHVAWSSRSFRTSHSSSSDLVPVYPSAPTTSAPACRPGRAGGASRPSGPAGLDESKGFGSSHASRAGMKAAKPLRATCGRASRRSTAAAAAGGTGGASCCWRNGRSFSASGGSRGGSRSERLDGRPTGRTLPREWMMVRRQAPKSQTGQGDSAKSHRCFCAWGSPPSAAPRRTSL